MYMFDSLKGQNISKHHELSHFRRVGAKHEVIYPCSVGFASRWVWILVSPAGLRKDCAPVLHFRKRMCWFVFFLVFFSELMELT